MQPLNRRALAAVAVVLILAGLGAVRAAAQSDRRCFPETGYCISGPIRTYWERNGGLPVFGYPITPLQSERVESWTGPVQWFERDRLEDHSAEGIGVLAGRLGVERLAQVGRPWQQRPAPPAAQGCRAFDETGYAMCGGFRAYWERNGGLERFGFPITDERDEVIEGRSYRVQYFERRRMEYHPEYGAGTVLLGLLGRDVRGASPPPRATTTVPVAASPTPTRTPSADDLGVAGNVSSFDNGGIVCTSGNVRIDAAQPPTDLFPTILQAPCILDFSFENFAQDQRIDIVVRRPDGGAFAETRLVVDDGAAFWRLAVLLDAPYGTYSVVIAPEGAAAITLPLEVGPPEGARALVLPPAADLRDTLNVYISGVPAGQRFELYLYRRNATGDAASFLRRLGAATSSGRGEGVLSFQMQPGDATGSYQAGFFLPPGSATGVAACTNDPRTDGGFFCFETFNYTP
jgi:hypothetical protein